MFSSTSAKSFYFFFLFTLVFSACGGQQNSENAADANQSPFIAQEAASAVPFASREPENYQAEIIVTVSASEEKIERKTFVARDGANRLTRFAVGEASETARLETADGKIFLLRTAAKIYAEIDFGQTAPAADGEALQQFLTTEWLNAKTGATFENQGAENNLTKFLVRFDDSSASEVLIFYDAAARTIARQEFYARGGEQRALLYTVEMKNFQTPTDAALFELPKDFRKVSVKEFEQADWR
jgi:hypothetical protein